MPDLPTIPPARLDTEVNTMVNVRRILTVAVAILSALVLAACGASGPGGGKSGPVEVVTHNAVGGGSDVFTRQLIKVMYDNKIINTQWPVRNVPAGDAIGAMSYLVDRKGNASLLAQVTPTWLATPMTIANSPVHLDQLTPISLVATEPQVVVTKAGGRFSSFADFVAAAKEAPDTLVQAGGSSTANDALTRSVLQDNTQAKWKFLSFEDTGSRITALLRDDADIMLGSASDVAEQVKADQLSVIAVIGDKRLDAFPEVSTTTEQKIDSSKVPVQFRAIMGAPDMPADAVQTYQDDLSKMVETDGWKTLATNDGLVTQNLQDQELSDYLAQQTEILGTLLGDLGLRKDQ
jgi:putative tricarboxylic transport membrane protein